MKFRSKPAPAISEHAITIISEETRLEGKVTFSQISRVHGSVSGQVFSTPGSTLILGESAVVEGNIQADTLVVDGYVKGDIIASTRVVISCTGRVIGNIQTPSLTVDFGAYFEGRSAMETPRAALSNA